MPPRSGGATVLRTNAAVLAPRRLVRPPTRRTTCTPTRYAARGDVLLFSDANNEWRPDAVGFSLNYLANVPEVLDLAAAVRRLVPECFIFVGGHSASQDTATSPEAVSSIAAAPKADG